jgi:hypothetical protein
MSRECWICGATPATREHVWAKWLKQRANSDVGRFQMGITTEPPETWRAWTGGSFEHTSRVLCKACNNGLSDLEANMGFLFDRLVKLVSGDSTWIDPTSQVLLARWLYKTALMVSTTLDHEAAHLSRHHYAELAGTLDLPPASVVWVGRLDDPVHEAQWWLQRFEWWDTQAVPATRCEGFSFLLGVKELIGFGVVFDLRQSPDSDEIPIRAGSLTQGKLVRVWPPSAHFGLKWPPPSNITVDDLESIRRTIATLDKQRDSKS